MRTIFKRWSISVSKLPLRVLAAVGLLSIFSLGLGLQSQPEKQSRPNFQWPIEKGQFPELKGITSSFAESRIDHFHNGVDIAGVGDPIRAMAPGYVLFSHQSSDDPFRPVQGPGNYVFLYHGQGWSSGYYHLQANASLARRGNLTAESIVGKAGNTGHSVGPHLHFFVSSHNGQRILNPLDVLPEATDSNPPIFGQLVIVTPNGQTLISHSREENIRLTQAYPVQIQIIDPGLEKYTRRGVHKLEWSLNKQNASVRVFDYLEFREGRWLLSGKYDFDSTFRYGNYNLGKLDFQHGRNLLKVRATDHAGNTSEVLFDVNVNRDF